MFIEHFGTRMREGLFVKGEEGRETRGIPVISIDSFIIFVLKFCEIILI